MYAAWIWSLSRPYRLFAPSRNTQKQAEADRGLLAKLARVGPAGEDIAKKWRNGKCNNRDVAQSLKKEEKALLKRPAKNQDDVVRRRPSQPENTCAPAQRRFRVNGKRPYSFLFKCTSQDGGTPSVSSSSAVACNLLDTSGARPVVCGSNEGQREVVDEVHNQEAGDSETLAIVPVSLEEGDELVRTKIKEALLARSHDALEVGCTESVLEKVALDVSVQFKKQLENTKPQLRTVLFNLRDQRNPDFFRDVITGKISPEQLPSLPSEDMASAAQRAERVAAQAQQVRESTLQRGASGAIDQNSLAAFKALRARR